MSASALKESHCIDLPASVRNDGKITHPTSNPSAQEGLEGTRQRSFSQISESSRHVRIFQIFWVPRLSGRAQSLKSFKS